MEMDKTVQMPHGSVKIKGNNNLFCLQQDVMERMTVLVAQMNMTATTALTMHGYAMMAPNVLKWSKNVMGKSSAVMAQMKTTVFVLEKM